MTLRSEPDRSRTIRDYEGAFSVLCTQELEALRAEVPRNKSRHFSDSTSSRESERRVNSANSTRPDLGELL